MIKTKCFHCNKIHFRSSGRVKESKKRNWKFYCSSECLIKSREKKKLYICGNPKCQNTLERRPSETVKSKRKKLFCSRSCSAIVNNSVAPKRKAKVKICNICFKNFSGPNKYCSCQCSRKAVSKSNTIPKEKILNDIINFYKSRGRIPFKIEYKYCKAARNRFGTWNKTILAAGLRPNPVKFAKKYIANDGHKCDSLVEKIIDDWLFARKIKHEVNIPYPNSKYTADFKINDIFIEFFGLHGQLKSYDRLMEKKLELVKNRNLKLISIYPEDIFPKFDLDRILGNIVKK